MPLVGNISKLRDLGKRLKDLPVALAQSVAQAVAPALTGQAQADFASGLTAYGEARPVGVHGNALSLVRSGITEGSIRFVAIGTRVRVAFGTPYAKYLVGKYRILPVGALPVAWSELIAKIARDELAKGMAA